MWPVVVLILGASLWGLAWIPLKYFHQQGVSDMPQILISFGFGALILLPMLWREYRQWRAEPVQLVLLLILGGYTNLAFAAAMIHGEVIRAMMLFYLAPVWGVLAARLFLKEGIDARRWLGLTAALLGIWLVLGPGSELDKPFSGADLLALTAGMAFALNNVTCRAAQQIPALSKTAAIFLGCLIMSASVIAVNDQPMPEISPTTLGWLAAFGIAWLLLASLANQWAVTRMEAGRASILLSSELVVAVVSATLIAGESLTTLEILGGILIITSTFLEASRPSLQTQTRPMSSNVNSTGL